jgi:protein-disulfide isomerase
MLKRLMLALAIGLAASACQQQGEASQKEPPVKTSSQAPVQGFISAGNPTAKLLLIEFAAPTCPVCKGWNDEVWPEIKSRYVDSGKIRYELHELPSHNPPVDAAVFGLARCVGADQSLEVIHSAFNRQRAIENATHSPGGAKTELLKLAKEFSKNEQQFDACLNDPKLSDHLTLVETEAEQLKVSGTPTLFLNGKMAPNDLASLSAMIDQQLAAMAMLEATPAPAAPTSAPVASPAPH